MGKHTFFLKEQEQWLCEKYFSFPSYAALTEQFNAAFGTEKSTDMIREKCTKRLGLKGMSNPTQYGKKPKEQLPLGTIRKAQTGTYIKVRMTPEFCNADITGYQKPYWLPLQEKIFREAKGDILPDQMVCFLNHNTEDFSIENLYPIDRKIAAIMSKNKWWSENPELTLAAIKWCELHYALQSVNGQKNRKGNG